MALTTDFTGTYDYEREEAAHLAESMLRDLADGYYRSTDEYHQALIKERAHWVKVFGDDELMRQFSEELNRLTFDTTNIAM